MPLETKYGFEFELVDIKMNVRRLTNQLWKLIPMRENKEDWRKQLDTVVIEIAGLNEIFTGPHFLQILSKLEGLKAIDTTFEIYRRTVFESISLIQELMKHAGL